MALKSQQDLASAYLSNLFRATCWPHWLSFCFFNKQSLFLHEGFGICCSVPEAPPLLAWNDWLVP